MSSKRVKIKPSLHLELRRISSSVAAFSVAVILVWIQGSFPSSSRVSVAIAMLAFAAPICTAASLLSFIFCDRDHVSKVSDRNLDRLMSYGVGFGLGGLLLLLMSKNMLIAGVFVVSVAIGMVSFWWIARSIDCDESEVDKE